MGNGSSVSQGLGLSAEAVVTDGTHAAPGASVLG